MQLIHLVINGIFIAIILVLGLIFCYEDYKSGKIRNKWIKLGGILGLICYFVLGIITILNSLNVIEFNIYQPDYYLQVFGNTIVAFVLAYSLWNFKLWAGGDAKLFTLYVLLMPLEFYGNWYLKYWPALTLLINIILPIFIYLFLKFLFYPIRLGANYLKSPRLLAEYYGKFKQKNKFDKTKIKSYISLALSFIVILIFFQILRSRLGDLLSPYLGQLLIGFYFLIGFVVFQPLRKLLQKKELLVSILIAVYFIIGAIFFRETVFADFHKIFALQFILILSYYYIFKYGQALGRFLYNSAEVKIVPVAEIRAGMYINKDYIRQILGSRYNFEESKKEISANLNPEEVTQLDNILKSRQNQTDKYFRLLSSFRSFSFSSIPILIQQLWQFKQEKKTAVNLLEKINDKLDQEQKVKLYNLLNKFDENQVFLKSLHGKLTTEQAEKLKIIIANRNQEVVSQGLAPVDTIILHKTFSFAPWMLLGVIITLITRSSLIHLVYQFLGR